LLRIQRKKNKRLGLSSEMPAEDDSGADDEDYDESMSMYEEEDEFDIHPEMSFDEDIDELQSYRNHQGQTNAEEGADG
jgi:hypothetical protein